LGLFKMTDRLLQGDKFSSALGKGAMTGATAFAAGQVGQALQGADAAASAGADGTANIGNQSFAPPPPGTDAVDAAAQTAVDAGKEGAKSAASTAATNRVAGAAADTATDTATGAAADAATNVAKEVVKGAGAEMFKGLSTDAMANDAIKQIADKIAAGALTDRDLTFLDSTKQFVAAQINDRGYQTAPKELWDHYNVLDAMVRKAVELPRLQESRARYIDAQDTVRHWALKESLGRPRGGVRLTEAGVNRVFELVAQQVLTEGIMDTLKGAAGAVTGAIKQTGKNLTTKITADKLKKAWEFEGGNTDSEAIKVFLKNQGVTPEIIDGAMKTVGIKAPAAPTAADPAAADPAAAAATPAKTNTFSLANMGGKKDATAAATATTTPATTAAPAATTAAPAAPEAPATPAAATTPAATTKTLTKPAAATTATTTPATTTPAAATKTLTKPATTTPAAKTATPAAPANYGTNFGTKATVTQKLPVPTAKA
jgi:hypothetical protein